MLCVCKAVVISHEMAGIPLGKEGFSGKPVCPCVLGAAAESESLLEKPVGIFLHAKHMNVSWTSSPLHNYPQEQAGNFSQPSSFLYTIWSIKVKDIPLLFFPPPHALCSVSE